MKPSSFCTIATMQCKQELAGFLFSLAIHHPYATVYIMCDKPTQSYIQNGYSPNLKIFWDVSLDTYSNYSRKEMEQLGIWSTFQMSKADILEKALTYEKDTLFLDSDIIILDTIDDIKNKELGVSPGFVNEEIVEKYGYYNGGMLWTNQKSLPNRWREYTKTSRYYDQASIEDLCNDYIFFKFKDNYNLQTWRFICGEEPIEKIMSYIQIKKKNKENKIMYKNRPLKFIHTHFNLHHFKTINDYFIRLLETANYTKELLCIHYVIYSKWHFYLANHNTSWNELVLTISKRPDIEYEMSEFEDTRLNTIVLNTLDFEIPKKIVLLEHLMTWKSYKERNDFNTHINKKNKEIYEIISKSRYGKEEIYMLEYMAFGTIPILKEKCKLHDYYLLESDPLLNEEDWAIMSHKCQEWYMKKRHSSVIWYFILDHIFE